MVNTYHRNLCSDSSKKYILNIKQNKMQKLLYLTSIEGQSIIIGVESIIKASRVYMRDAGEWVTKIQSRGAMIETSYVTEDLDTIFKQYNRTK